MWLTAPVPSGSAEVARRYVTLPPIVRTGYVTEDWEAAVLPEALPDAVEPPDSRHDGGSATTQPWSRVELPQKDESAWPDRPPCSPPAW